MKKILGICILLNLGMGFLLWQQNQPPRLVMLDVAQGDSIYIQGQKNFTVLIDGGPDNAVLTQLSRVMPLTDRTIDVLMMTHSDADHSTGLVAVAQQYTVRRFVWNGVARDSATMQALFAALHKQGSEVIVGQPGLTLTSGTTQLRLLGPAPDFVNNTANVNDTSLVVRLLTPHASVLLVGDVGFAAEQSLLANHQYLRSSVLKVGHHGSKTSSGENFLKAVQPREALISVGAKNHYGHPTSETLQRLEAIGAHVQRTDQQGAITVRLE